MAIDEVRGHWIASGLRLGGRLFDDDDRIEQDAGVLRRDHRVLEAPPGAGALRIAGEGVRQLARAERRALSNTIENPRALVPAQWTSSAAVMTSVSGSTWIESFSTVTEILCVATCGSSLAA